MLFADEALEWRGEQEKAAAEARAATPVAEPLPFINNKTFDYVELEQAAEPTDAPAEQPAESSLEPTVEPQSLPPAEIAELGADAPSEPQALAENSGEESAPNPDAEPREPVPPEPSPEEVAKQAARQRDREARLVIRELLDELIEDYEAEGSGIEIREIAGGFRMATKPEYHDAVRAFVKSLKPALKLSLPALETLAVIAYKQPVTAPEVNEIRGVDSSGVFGSLLARKLIATAGRKQVVGRPILYKTTKEFLLRFGLKDVSELPSMEEFEKIAASEYEETEVESTESEPASNAEEADPETLEVEPDSTSEQQAQSNPEATSKPEATPELEAASRESDAEIEPSNASQG
jgi:segregation and condensation protein B